VTLSSTKPAPAHSFLRSCIPFVDSNGVLFMVAGGAPRKNENSKDPWDDCIQRVIAKTALLRKKLKFSHRSEPHRRGWFNVARRGLSH
jgi:hypothetical protein